MKPNRLLVVPMVLPGDVKREELNRAINFQLFEMLGDKITFLDFDEEFGLYKYITGDPDFIKDCCWHCHGYKELKERHMEILECVDNVLIYGMQVNNTNFNSGNSVYTQGLPKMTSLESIKIELDKCHRKDDYGFVNFGTRVKLKNVLSRMIFIECLGELDVNVFHYMVDPREVDLTPIIGKDRYHILGGLKSTVGPSKPMPFFEWGIENTFIQELPKEMDFFYFGVCYGKSKFRLRDITSKFNDCLNRRKPSRDSFSNTLSGYAGVVNDVYNTKIGRSNDKVVTQSEYYYKLMISRYTFVNKPYMDGEFNYQRFIEAIILGCIPFIDNEMDLNNLQLTYHEFYDIIIKNKLIIDTEASSYKDIATRMKNYKENGDSDLIEKFKNTKAYRALIDSQKIKECWRKKLGWK